MRFPARVSRSRSKSLRRRKLRFELRGVAVMTEEHAPNEGAMKIAEEGIRGMIHALGAEVIAPDVMIDAALHILAAWIASSQTNSTSTEREADMVELEEALPSYIEYHRSAKWLSSPVSASQMLSSS